MVTIKAVVLKKHDTKDKSIFVICIIRFVWFVLSRFWKMKTSCYNNLNKTPFSLDNFFFLDSSSIKMY